MSRNLLLALPALALLHAPSPGFAEDVQANDFTAADAGISAVAQDAQGDFTVTWVSDGSPGSDADGASVQARRFFADGTPKAGQFQVNTTTAGEQDLPEIAMAPDGRAVVVWQSPSSPGGDADGTAVLARRFDAAGAAAGADFQVNVHSPGDQEYPAVAVQDDGDFLVVWHGPGEPSPGTGPDVLGRFFTADGSPVGGEVLIGANVDNGELWPAVELAPDGGFLVAYVSRTDAGEASVVARRVDASGLPQGDAFQVSSGSGDSPSYPRLDFSPSGDFVVAWTRLLGTFGSLDFEAVARRFDAAGTPLGEDFILSTTTEGSQLQVDVGVDGEGGFLAAWTSLDLETDTGPDGSGAAVQGRRFSSLGGGGEETTINAYTTGSQALAKLAMRQDGSAVVTWTSQGSEVSPGRGSVILTVLPATRLFADGFESGDTDAWSLVAP